MKLANGNTGHAQGIGVLLCSFPSCSIIYPLGPVYYFPGHPYNIISSCDLKFYVGFKKVTSEPLEHCDFVDTRGHYWRSPYQTHKNIDHIKIEIFKVNPHRDRNIVAPTLCALSKKDLSDYSSAFLVVCLLPD